MTYQDIPKAPKSIQKGSTLKSLLDSEAVDCLASNLKCAHPAFDVAAFKRTALHGLEPLGIMQRGLHLAGALKEHLPARFEAAARILVRSLGKPLPSTAELGLATFFYLPHVCYVGTFGVNPRFNEGKDPFEISMWVQHELTRRFTAEFSMRQFLLAEQKRTLARLLEWTRDPDPHVRRLCSEGARPRLPWAVRLPAFIADPRPALPILEALRDDPCLYVRRSVANHIGDIAKDHPQLALDTCARWLKDSTPERRWLIRHALRHPAKKGNSTALRLRKRAA